MNVRLLNSVDARDYRALRLRGLWEYPEAFTSSHDEEEGRLADWYEKRLASAGTRFWGAFEDGQLCGVVGLDRELRMKNRHKATVVGMYVAAESAGRGIGQALVEALVAGARADGVELLVLTVTEGNTAAEQLYTRCGFSTFGVEPRAIKIDGRPYAKKHMYLDLTES